jgi:hypothetical protein
MKFKLEYLNQGTGVCLCIAGIIYMLQSDYTSALSWGIFGAMYLVMDDYKPNDLDTKKIGHRVRELFAFVGFALSLVLLALIL